MIKFLSKFTKKVISIAIVLLIVMPTSSNVSAAENYQLDDISNLLSNLENKQVVQASENEMLQKMIDNNQITREELNKDLYEKSTLNKESLKSKGYTESQIETIQSYDGTSDALAYTASSASTLIFQYGLAGTGTKKKVMIAYDLTWTTCPFFTITDSFGIGWIAADSNSNELMTETVSATGEALYYTMDGELTGSRNININTNTNGVATGNPIIGSAGGSYAKRMGGVINVKTQSASYNMQTIQIFVAYAHTVLSIHVSAGVTIGWEKISGGITFAPTARQEMIVQDHHNFSYNSQAVIVAD